MLEPHHQGGGAPKAGRTAKGAGIAGKGANTTGEAYAIPSRHRKRVVHAIGPAGRITVVGQEARALESLIERGAVVVIAEVVA